MTEIEKISIAKAYVEKLANGINPLTGKAVPDSDTINDVKISRCLFYVSDVLQQVVENGGISTHKSKRVKYSFALDYEARKKFKYSETPITISEITRRINDLIDPEKMKKLSYKYILDWLIEIELLTVSTDSTGKRVRRPTYNGADIGIGIENRVSANGPYQVVVYNKAAQMFILDNLDAVIMQNGTK